MCSQSQLVEDGVDSLLDRAFAGYGNAGFTLGIVLIDSVVMGNNAQQAHTVLVDLLADHIADLAAGSAVDDEAHLGGAQLQINNHVAETACGLYAAAGAVADQNDGVHLGQNTAAQMLPLLNSEPF